MDKVVDEFARVLKKHNSISAIGAIDLLRQRCPNDVSFTTTLRNGPNGDEASYYYCEVIISNQSSYVASNICKQTAEENSATIAYNVLKGKVESKVSQRLSFDHRDNSRIENILSHEVLAAIAILKKFGYKVDILDFPRLASSSYGLEYYVSFKIPGFGEFPAVSSESRLAAIEDASEKFLSAYDEDFVIKPFKAGDLATSQDVSTLSASPALSQHTASSSSAPSSILELIGFEGPFVPKRSLTNADKLWIDLINRFNEANLPSRTATEVIGELVTTELMQYKLDIEKFANKNGRSQNRYKTTLNFANHSITKKDLTEDESRLKVYSKAYRLFKKLSTLVLTVKHGYSPTKSSLEIKSEIPKECMRIIAVSTKNRPDSGTFYANVRLADHMFFHEATSDNEAEALTAVYSSLLAYLKSISDYVYEKPSTVSSEPSPDSSFTKSSQSLVSETTSAPCLSNSSLAMSSSSGYQSGSSLDNSQSQIDPFSNEALSKAVQKLQAGSRPFLPITRNIPVAVHKLGPLAQLISHFNQVYRVDLSPMEIINRLFENRPLNPLVEFNKKHQVYVCQLKVPELGTLCGASVAVHEAYQKASNQAFDMLHNFSSIVSSFKLIRSTSLSPDFNMKIIMETFLALNTELISKKTWPISSHRHQSCFTIESFHVRFEGEGNSSQESQCRAFYQLFQFMDQLCGQVTGSITLNKPAHHQSEEINPLAGKIANRRPVQVREPDMPLASIKAMELIYRFYRVYSLNEERPAVEVIAELSSTVKNLIAVIDTSRDYDQLGNLRYKTLLNVAHLCSFTATKDTRESSKNEAFLLLYNRLLGLSRLTQKILRVSSNDKQTIHDKVLKWCGKFPQLLKCNVNRNTGTATLMMTNINVSKASGKDEQDAIVNAFYQLSGALSRLKEEAINSTNVADNVALEALKMETALAQASNISEMDASIAARIKLLIDFLTLYSPAKTPMAIVDEMIAKNDGIAFIRKRSTFNGLAADAIATISVTDVGEFHHCAKSSTEAFDKCAIQLYNFLARLNNLLNDFNDFYDSAKPASVVIKQLLQKGHFHLIKVYQLKLSNAQGDANGSFLSVVELDRMRSFGRVAGTLEDAICAASIHAITYLKKLSGGVPFDVKTSFNIQVFNIEE